MTRTIRTLRMTAGSMLAEIGAAVGTFLGLAWLGANAVIASAHLADASATDIGIPETGVWVAIFGVAVCGTIWLEGGGYHRLDADAARGGDFAWLAICFLPMTFLPAAYALSLLVDPVVVVNLYLLACGVLAGWLAFFGGLDRLGIEADQFSRPVLIVLGGSILVVLLTSILPLAAVTESLVGEWTTEAYVLAAVALLAQGAVVADSFGDESGRRIDRR